MKGARGRFKEVHWKHSLTKSDSLESQSDFCGDILLFVAGIHYFK